MQGPMTPEQQEEQEEARRYTLQVEQGAAVLALWLMVVSLTLVAGLRRSSGAPCCTLSCPQMPASAVSR